MPLDSNVEKLSPRQIQLIQGTAFLLIQELCFSKEEAIKIIAESLREELNASKVSFEFLEIGTLSYREDFVRKLVERVELKIVVSKNIPQEKIKATINSFIQMIYESWKHL